MAENKGSSNLSGNSMTRGSGFDGCIISVIVIGIIAVISTILFFHFLGDDLGLNIETSTVNREILPQAKCDPIDKWYQDDWGDWIDENGEEEALIDGMKLFYEKTGVQPYLWITGENGRDYISEGSVEDLAADTYQKMFGDDEGHLLVIFREYPNESSNYISTVWPGKDAQSQIMDEQAREIFLDYIDYYYTDMNLNEGQFFAKAFEKSATRIMSRQIPLNALIAIVIVSIIVVGTLVIIVHIMRKRKVAEATMKAAKARAEKDQKQIEFAQQKYNDQMETTYIAVTCPNCGSSGNKVQKGTVGYCSFCGSSFVVDQTGKVKISGEK